MHPLLSGRREGAVCSGQPGLPFFSLLTHRYCVFFGGIFVGDGGGLTGVALMVDVIGLGCVGQLGEWSERSHGRPGERSGGNKTRNCRHTRRQGTHRW